MHATPKYIDPKNIQYTSGDSEVAYINKSTGEITTGTKIGSSVLTAKCENLVASIIVRTEDLAMFYVDDVMQSSGLGTNVTGTLLSGKISTSSSIHLFNPPESMTNYQTRVNFIRMTLDDLNFLEEANTGEHPYVTLDGVLDKRIAIGAMIMDEDAKRPMIARKFTGTLSLSSARSSSAKVGFTADFNIGGANYSAVLKDAGDLTEVKPGETCENIQFELAESQQSMVAVYIGQKIDVYEDGMVIGELTITDAETRTVNYEFPPMANLDLWKKSAVLGVRDTIDMRDYMVYENLDPADVVIMSRDESIAKIDGTKVITTGGVGDVTISLMYPGTYQDFEITTEDNFMMYTEELYNISGRGALVSGRVLSGSYHLNDPLNFAVAQDSLLCFTAKTTSIRKLSSATELQYAYYNDKVGLYLEPKVLRSDLKRGTLLFTPGSKRPIMTRQLTGKMYLLSKEDGGRHTPVNQGYRPYMYCGTMDYLVSFTDFNGSRQMFPGDTIYKVTAKVADPVCIPTYIGQKLAIREGGKTIGYFIVDDAVPEQKTYAELPTPYPQFTRSQVGMAVGDEVNFKRLINPVRSSMNKVSLQVEDTSIAWADTSGRVTALREGSTNVIADIDGETRRIPLTVENGFLFYNEQTMTISGRGAYMTGTVQAGSLANGENVKMVGCYTSDGIATKTITEMIVMRQTVNEVVAGDNVGMNWRGMTADEAPAGVALIKAGTKRNIVATTSIRADVTVLTADQGGLGENISANSYFYLKIGGRCHQAIYHAKSAMVPGQTYKDVEIELYNGSQPVVYLGQEVDGCKQGFTNTYCTKITIIDTTPDTNNF